MIVTNRDLIKKNKSVKYPNIKCLYGTIPRDIRMHMYRVSQYAQFLFKKAKERGIWDHSLPQDIFEYSEEIFKLHDIGRHYISTEIYNKVEELTTKEKQEIRNHTIYALNAEESVYLPLFPEHIMLYFRGVAVMHHERYDGQGYPYGKAADAIPFMARVCAIADAFDGMVSWKTYRERMTCEQAMKKLLEEAGGQFQRELVECFVECSEEIEQIELAMRGKE